MRAERLELPDGDFLDLNWLDSSSAEAPIVFIFHGLQGSVDSPYVGRTLNALRERGLRALFVHFRSCSGEPNRLARGYHAGDTGDIAHVIKTIHEREPLTRLGAMGFSLGGNALLKHLGEAGKDTLIHAAVAVSVPYDLAACSGRLDRGFLKIYRGWLLGMIFRSVKQKRALLEAAGVDVDAVIASETLRELDARLIAPLLAASAAANAPDQSAPSATVKPTAPEYSDGTAPREIEGMEAGVMGVPFDRDAAKRPVVIQLAQQPKPPWPKRKRARQETVIAAWVFEAKDGLSRPWNPT